ncbi:hypothetical protein RM704_15145 [Streptomyces sp. DSM 3412]|uniref:Uncharacterized protein n=1 Tax=Streptomyces gottesmaniae TaxID=3075518 RepID=A0ABU2YXN2_9ACTN|nr:hypothetical protein [Streptomyces sp. DSM 3412]MDT0568789.1 hypothetical protein [Streptomyces sp. DSM 3412]
MKASRRVRAGGTLGHLLLIAVLALSVFAMHSTGHPDESAHPGGESAHVNEPAHISGSMHVSESVPFSEPVPFSGSAHSMNTAAHATATDAAPTGSQSSHEPAPTMDMQSLCVAILLGAWVLTALLMSAFARRHEEWAELLAQVAALARPRPPPRGPDLTRLSVLRL